MQEQGWHLDCAHLGDILKSDVLVRTLKMKGAGNSIKSLQPIPGKVG